MAKGKLEWHTEKRKVKDLIPTDNNPNVNNDQQFSKLKKSMKRDGYVEIIAADINGKIVAGNHRQQAMMEMGMADTEIDVRIPSRKLTKEEFHRYLIASNALHGDWDFETLFKNYDSNLLVDLIDEDILAQQWDTLLEIEDDDFDETVELAKIKKVIIKPGEFFKLGEHTLGCIDSTDEKMVRKLVGQNKIDFVDVDPPFGIRYNYQGKNGKY